MGLLAHTHSAKASGRNRGVRGSQSESSDLHAGGVNRGAETGLELLGR